MDKPNPKTFPDNLKHFVRFWDKFVFIAIACLCGGVCFEGPEKWFHISARLELCYIVYLCYFGCLPAAEAAENTTQSFVVEQKKVLENVFLLVG